MAEKNKSNEIRIVRVYDAPVRAVWDAWTDPAQVGQWWGPRGFTLTTHSKDLRPGGTWRYTMHGPDGTDYPNVTHYFEVEPLAKLVYDHGASDERPAMFRVTVTFAESGGKTTMDMRMTLPTPEEAEQTRAFIKKAGGNGTWDRLGEYLDKAGTGAETFFINRSFEAPVGTMFEMWTDPKHVAQWTPPTGATMEFVRADIRSGGSSFYLMKWGNGMEMYGRVRYLAIEKPEGDRPSRLVYEQEFADEKGNLSRHPMAPTWPATMRTTVLLTAEGEEQTRVTVRWEAVGSATSEEMATFIKGRAGMTGGWTGSFDKLEEYLANQ